jgi:hypothetical protein
MVSRRSVGSFVILVAGLAGCESCERAKQPPPIESAAVMAPVGAESTHVPRVRTWDASAGPVLLVAGEAPAEALVVAPDSGDEASVIAALPNPAGVTLFGRDGSVQSAELQRSTAGDLCRAWPLNAAPPPHPWNVGFVGGVVAPLPLDSLESLGRADSTKLVATAIRLASAIPNDSAGRFTGLPFTVRGLWRFTLPRGGHAFVATLVRQINQEATPLQERTFLVAEPDPTFADSAFASAYNDRSYGNEESIETRDVLAVIQLGSERRPTVIISRDFGDSMSFGFIERADSGHWRVRWSSPLRRC